MAELAGLALATLPLIISCAENYSRVIEAFSRYQHYPQEVKELRSKLRIQRTRFKVQTKALLAPLFTPDELSEMLSNPQSPAWSDDKLCSSFESYLGDSRHAIIDCSNLISSKLRTIEAKCERFHTVLSSHSQVQFKASAGKYIATLLTANRTRRPNGESSLKTLWRRSSSLCLIPASQTS